MEFLWHDYETFGTRPAVDRPCQFAAQRTDADLNPVDDPITLFCSPADDVIPRPCLDQVVARTRFQARVLFSRNATGRTFLDRLFTRDGGRANDVIGTVPG